MKLKESSREYSLSRSQVINIIIREEPFEIDKEWIRKDLDAPYNKEKQRWYFNEEHTLN